MFIKIDNVLVNSDNIVRINVYNKQLHFCMIDGTCISCEISPNCDLSTLVGMTIPIPPNTRVVMLAADSDALDPGEMRKLARRGE
jgi:hypothetical protein